MRSVTVKYHVRQYKGFIDLNVEDDDDNDIITAKAKKRLTEKVGPLPFGYQSFKVIREV